MRPGLPWFWALAGRDRLDFDTYENGYAVYRQLVVGVRFENIAKDNPQGADWLGC
jgi:hypothetical protein